MVQIFLVQLIQAKVTMDIEGDISTGENEITLTFSEKYNDDAKIIDGTNDYKNIREYFSNNGYTCR